MNRSELEKVWKKVYAVQQLDLDKEKIIQAAAPFVKKLKEAEEVELADSFDKKLRDFLDKELESINDNIDKQIDLVHVVSERTAQRNRKAKKEN